MYRWVLGWLLVTFIMAPTLGGAQNSNGDDWASLLEDCAAALRYADPTTRRNSLEELGAAARCTSYLQGFVHAYVFYGPKDICVPAGNTFGDAIRATMQWVRTHPAARTQPWYVVIHDVLLATYPCRPPR